MRITERQKKAILESVAKELGDAARVFLFGSRVDDNERGGDIDLMVEVPVCIDDRVRKKLLIIGRIKRTIGDRKIDLIITWPDEYADDELPLILKNARKEGVLL